VNLLRIVVFVHDDIYDLFSTKCSLKKNYVIVKGTEAVEERIKENDIGLVVTSNRDFLFHREKYGSLKERFTFLSIAVVVEANPPQGIDSELIDDALTCKDNWSARINNIALISKYNREHNRLKNGYFLSFDGIDLIRGNSLLLPGKVKISYFEYMVKCINTSIRLKHLDKVCMCVSDINKRSQFCSYPYGSSDRLVKNDKTIEICDTGCTQNRRFHLAPVKLNFRSENYIIGWIRSVSLTGSATDDCIARDRSNILTGILGAWASEAYNCIFQLFKEYIEKERISREEKLKGIIMDSIDYGIISIDKENKVNYINRNAGEFFNVSFGDVKRKKFIDAIESGKRKEEDLMLYNTLVTGNSYNNVLREICINGKYKRAIFDTAQIKDSKGETAGAVLIFKDITRMKEEEERKGQWEKLLLAGELAASISHEIKNPLSVISGLMQLFRDRDDLDRQDIKRYAAMALKEMERIQNLLKDYLSMTKPGRIKPEVIQIADVLDEFISFIRLSTDTSQVSIELEIGEGLPPICVDVSQLKQIILNLVQNAVQAIEGSGKVIVRVLYDPNRERVVIEVEDNGKGIPEECLDKILKPFYTTKESGTGLGLFLCRRLIIDNGGTIEVKSKPGVGSKFIIAFPIHK
jgi:two-component system sensor histidine kinase AtoS